ncbi:autotransporter domain-containing protein [Candidatus Sarmatiella mevalonica]|uniref:autotransporter domain-containing protein n=1 Tax=Candidatus Sarmatiella mevalonica TaxID=2770581 RepID=UPI0019214168|nr:autotransporter outer membrane beta-barrel domain-containing protein [Candidatus Sarmatiella mevalonica]
MIQKNKIQKKKNNKKRNVVGVVGKTLLTSALVSGAFTADALAGIIADLGVTALEDNNAAALTIDVGTMLLGGNSPLYVIGNAAMANNAAWAQAETKMTPVQKKEVLTFTHLTDHDATVGLTAAAGPSISPFSAYSLYAGYNSKSITLTMTTTQYLSEIPIGVTSAVNVNAGAAVNLIIAGGAGTPPAPSLASLTGLPNGFDVVRTGASAAMVLTGRVPVEAPQAPANRNKFYNATGATSGVAIARNTFNALATIDLANAANNIRGALVVDIEAVNADQGENGWKLGGDPAVTDAGNAAQNVVFLDATSAPGGSVIVKNVKGKGSFNISKWGATNAVGVLNVAPEKDDTFILNISPQVSADDTKFTTSNFGAYANALGLGQAGPGTTQVTLGQVTGDVWITNGAMSLDFAALNGANIADTKSGGALIKDGSIFAAGGDLTITTRTGGFLFMSSGVVNTIGTAGAAFAASDAAAPTAFIANNTTIKLRDGFNAAGIVLNKISVRPNGVLQVEREKNVANATNTTFNVFAIVDSAPANGVTPMPAAGGRPGVFYGADITSVQSVTLTSGTVLAGLSLTNVLVDNTGAAAAGNLMATVRVTKGIAIFNEVKSAGAPTITFSGANFGDAIVGVPNAESASGTAAKLYTAAVQIDNDKCGTLLVNASRGAATAAGVAVEKFTFESSNIANAQKSLQVIVADDSFAYAAADSFAYAAAVTPDLAADLAALAKPVTADMTVKDIILTGYETSQILLASAADKTLTAEKLRADSIEFHGYGRQASQFVVTTSYRAETSAFNNALVTFNGTAALGNLGLSSATNVFINGSAPFNNIASTASAGEKTLATIATANSVSVNGALPGVRLAFTAADKKITAGVNGALLQDGDAPIRVGGVANTASATQITEESANAPILETGVKLTHANSIVKVKSSAGQTATIEKGIFETKSGLKRLVVSGGAVQVDGTVEEASVSGGTAKLGTAVLANVSGGVLTVDTAEELVFSGGEVIVTKKLTSAKMREAAQGAVQKMTIAAGSQLNGMTFEKAGYSGTLSTKANASGATAEAVTITSAIGGIGSDGVASGLAQLDVSETPILFKTSAVINKVVLQTPKVGGITVTGNAITDGEISPIVYVVNSLTRANANAASVAPLKVEGGAVLIRSIAAPAPAGAKSTETPVSFAISLNAGGGIQVATDMTASIFVSAEQEAAKTFVLARALDKVGGAIVLTGSIGTKNSRVGALVVDNCSFAVNDVYATAIELRGVGRLKVSNLSTAQVSAVNLSTNAEELAGIQLVNTTPLTVDAIIGSSAAPMGVEISGKDVTFSSANVFLDKARYTPATETKDAVTVTFANANVGNTLFESKASGPFWVVLGQSQSMTQSSSIKSGGFKLRDGVVVTLKNAVTSDFLSVNDGKASVIVEGATVITGNLGATGASLTLAEFRNETAVTGDLYAANATVTGAGLKIDGKVKVTGGIAVIKDSAIVFSGNDVQADVKLAVAAAAEKTTPVVGVEFSSDAVNFVGTLGAATAPLSKLIVSKDSKAFAAAGAIYAQEMSMPRVTLTKDLVIGCGQINDLREISLGTHKLSLTDGAIYTPTGTVVLNLDVETKEQFGRMSVTGAKTSINFSKVEKLEIRVKPAQALSSSTAASFKILDSANGGSIVNAASDKITVTSTNDKIAFKMLGNTLVMNSGSGGGGVSPEDIEYTTKSLEDAGLTHENAKTIAEATKTIYAAAAAAPNSQAANMVRAISEMGSEKVQVQATTLALQNAAGTTGATMLQSNNMVSTGMGMNNMAPDAGGGAINLTDSGLGQAAGDDCAERNGSSVWLKPFYNFGDQKKLGQTEGYKNRQFGFMLGGKHTVTDSGTTLGMTLGYLGGKNKLKGMMTGSYTDSRDILVMVYASQKIYNGFSLGALLAYGGGQNKSSSVRIVGVDANGAPMKKNAIGNYSVNNTLFQLRAEYNSLFNDVHVVNPYITFGALSVGGFEYKENGAGVFDQTVKSGASTVFQCTLGTNYSADIQIDEGGVLRPGAFVNVSLSGKNKATTTIQFTGADPIVAPTAQNQTFMYNLGVTLDVKRNGFEVGVGLGFSGAKSYTGAIGVLNVKFAL